MLGVVLEQGARERDHRLDALAGDAVVDGPELPAACDEAAPAQAGEVGGDLRLRGVDQLDELADGALAVGQRL